MAVNRCRTCCHDQQRDGRSRRAAERQPGCHRRERVRPQQEQRKPERAAKIRLSQARVNTRVPFVPPNPNELDIAVRMDILRATFGT